MQYLLMICDREADQPQPGTERFTAYMQRWGALFAEYQATGMVLPGGGKLAPGSAAKTVRIRNGKRLITDGPFSESKELLGGYTVLDCDTLEEALEYAAKIPVAEWGSVEVRPFVASGYPPRSR